MKPGSFYKVTWTLIALVILAQSARALTVPYTEDFDLTAENWANSDETAFVDHQLSGGPDGGAHVSTMLSFQNFEPGDAAVLFRGHDDYSFSGNNFIGDWLTNGVRRGSVFVRHNAPVPLTYFLRISGPGNFPGAIGLRFAPVFPNTWTEMEIDFGFSSPQLILETDETGLQERRDFWETVLSNVGHMQIGVSTPAALADNPAVFTFRMDKVNIETPEPGSATLAIGALIMLLGCRRLRGC